MKQRSLAQRARSRPRIAAAIAFGAAGGLLPALLYLPSILERPSTLHLASFLLLPIVCAGAAGALLGPCFAEASGGRAWLRGILAGAGVMLIAFVAWAAGTSVLFALAPGTGSEYDAAGLLLLLLAGGGAAVGWAIVCLGGAVGFLLARILRPPSNPALRRR